MRITESKLRRIIRSILLEANVYKHKEKIQHDVLFDNYLQDMLTGHQDDALPLIKAIYTGRGSANDLNRNKLLHRFIKLKKLKYSQVRDPYKTFFTKIDKKVSKNGNKFKKEMLGEFFLENEVKPIDVFYFLKKYFIIPTKNFESWPSHKIPILRSNSTDFKIEIDPMGWNNLKRTYGNFGKNQTLNINNLNNLPSGMEKIDV